MATWLFALAYGEKSAECNANGQLGTGDSTARDVPTLVGVDIWASGSVTAVGAGEMHTVVVAGVAARLWEKKATEHQEMVRDVVWIFGGVRHGMAGQCLGLGS